MSVRLATVTACVFYVLAGWPAIDGAASSGEQTASVRPVPASLAGVVTDPAGTPIAGAVVSLHVASGDGALRQVMQRTSGRDGRFSFASVAAGPYLVRVVQPGFKTTESTVSVPATGSLTIGLMLEAGDPAEKVLRKASALSDLAAEASAGSGRTVATTPPPPPTPAPPPVQRAAQEMTVGAGAGGRGGGAANNRVAGVRAPILRDPNTEDYAAIRSNTFNLSSVEPLSTFAADVDTASFTNVRRFLNDGQLPPVDAVRVEEFVNYFHYDYPDPTGVDPVSVSTEVGVAPWAPDHRLVLVGVKAQPIEQREVGRRNIVLLIDVSGSMGSPDKLPLVKTGLRMFVDTLRDDDRIAIVVYAGASGLVLPSTRGDRRDRIHDAIENLSAGGSTNGAEGLQLAYRVASEQFVDGGINRVILATDGDFNVGLTSQSELLHLIEEKKKSGIFLSVLGVGTGNLKDSTMEMIADKGNGHYAYLDSLHEARRVLVSEGGATLETVAKDVKFQVEFNPATVAAWKLIGYENRLLAHQDFNDDRKDGGELGAGHTVTVLYEVVPVGVELPRELTPENGRPVVDDLTYQRQAQSSGESRDLLTVKVRFKLPNEEVSTLLARPVRDGGEATRLPLAASVAEFGLLLRDPQAGQARWAGLADRIRNLDVDVSDAADRQGLLDLVELAAGLTRLRLARDGGR